MKTGWLIYQEIDAKQNASYIDWFQEEAKKQGIQLNLILREEIHLGIINNQKKILLHNQEMISLADFAIIRTIEPMLSLHLEALGIPVFNSSIVSLLCNNKARTHHYLNKLGIPMVTTLYGNKQLFGNEPPLPYPFIAKDVTGRGGKQVYYIRDKHEWTKCEEYLKNEIILQSADVQLGKDLRVFVVGKEIVGAVLRESSTDDFRANFKLGGHARLYDLQAAEKMLIEKIIHHFDFGMVGIDFLISHQGELLFNEIEDVVGSRTLSACSDINILEKYMTFIKEKIT